MSFKYNPLTGELNVFGVKEMNDNDTPTPTPPITPNDSSVEFYGYVSASFTNSAPYTWIPFQNLSIKGEGSKFLSEGGVFTCPTTGIYLLGVSVDLAETVGEILGNLTSSTGNSGGFEANLSNGFPSPSLGFLEKGVSYTFHFYWQPSGNNPSSVTVQPTPLGSCVSGKLLQAY